MALPAPLCWSRPVQHKCPVEYKCIAWSEELTARPPPARPPAGAGIVVAGLGVQLTSFLIFFLLALWVQRHPK